MSAEPAYGIQYRYLDTLDLSTSEYLKLYKKAIVGIPESDRYDPTRSKWTEFYQELEDDVSAFGFKAAVLIVTTRYGGHTPTEIKDIILPYPSITQVMVDSHCEILLAENAGSNMGRHPTAKYSEKQAIIAQHLLRHNIIGLWIKNYLTTDNKRK